MSGFEAVEVVRFMFRWEVVVVDEALRAWRARVLAEEEDGRGASIEGVAGEEEERVRAGALGAERPLGLDAISPLAAATLLVKEEIAQPAHEEVSFEGVPIRGVAPFVVAVVPEGGRAVSGRVDPYLRTRVR